MAIQHTDKPKTRITAGLLMAKVYRNSDGFYLSGFACEYAGNGAVEEAEANLREAMQQLFERRYIQSPVLQTGVRKIGCSYVHTGKIVWDDSCGHRFCELPCASIKTRSGGNPIPQRQVAREIHDRMREISRNCLGSVALALGTHAQRQTDLPPGFSRDFAKRRGKIRQIENTRASDGG